MSIDIMPVMPVPTTGNKMNICSQILSTKRQLKDLVKSLCAEILALPDNPRIKRINKRCFIISSKDLLNNWSPEHHDFAWQYREIVGCIINSPSSKCLKILEKMIRTQTIKTQGYSTRLHPDVIENLKMVMGDRNDAIS